MGRPKLADQEKRQQVNFRLDPAKLQNLALLAMEHQLSVPALAEKLVVDGMELFFHPMMEPPLVRIFTQIMDEMQEVQRRNNDKPWYKDLTTWASCKMIFAKGPFARRNPDDWKRNPAIDALWAKVAAARKSKQEVINLLAELGVAISPERFRDTYGRRGIFGSKKVNALMMPTDNRLSEGQAIKAIKDDSTMRQATVLFSIVERFDNEESEAMDRWYSEVSNYTDAEKEGVELYKEWRRDIVREQLARGEFPSLEDYY